MTIREKNKASLPEGTDLETKLESMESKESNGAPAYRDYTVGKAILIVILLACLAFIFLQKDCFLKSVSYFNDTKVEHFTDEEEEAMQANPASVKTNEARYSAAIIPERKISMLGNKTVSQKFTAQDKRLGTIFLFFNNPKSYTAKGEVEVSLQNKDGKTLAKTSVEPNLVAHNSRTRLSFTVSSTALNSNGNVSSLNRGQGDRGFEIEQGETYYLVVKSKKLTSEGAVDLLLMDFPTKDDKTLTVDGKVMEGEHMYTSLHYRHFTKRVFGVFVVFVGLAILFILIPWGRIEAFWNRRRAKKGKEDIHINRFFLRLMFVATPFFCYYLLAKISGLTTTATVMKLLTFEGLLNLFILGLIWWIFYAIVNRTKWAIVFPTLITFLFGMTNYLLLVFRDSPLIATDFGAWQTAMQVAGGYTVTFNKSSLWLIMLTVIWICVALSLKSYKGLTWKKRIVSLLILAIWGYGFYYVFFQSTIIQDHNINVSGFKPKWRYKDHGYALSFMVTVKSSIVEKPEGYSLEVVEKIASDYTSDDVAPVKNVTKKTPNVIVIMNESFSDLAAIGEFGTNKDYMPFYNSLKENTIKGTMHTSVLGGSTANTEFEFLSGDTMQFLPFHSFPYNNMIRENLPSLTWAMRSRGYGGNTAFHPGMANSYNRNQVYPYLGFEKHIALEDLNDPVKIRDFVSDEQDYQTLEAEYETFRKANPNTPYYMFNVTIQNHGGYALSNGIVNGGIHISEDAAKEEEAEQYLNLIKMSDDALKGLITYFERVEEPTVIVFFGDHQPRVGGSFYDALYAKTKYSSDLDKGESRYRVPFFIWTNYDIAEKDNVEISANYLSSYMLQQTGGQMTGYNKFLMDVYEEVPVITDICYYGKDGKIYDPSTSTKGNYKDILKKYRYMQYNHMFGKSDRLDAFFNLKGASTEDSPATATND